MPTAFLIKADQYLRFDVDVERVDAGDPKPRAHGWSCLVDAGFERDVDCAVDLGAGTAFLFKGGNYVRVNQSTNAVDAPVRTIAGAWPGLDTAGFAENIDAAVNWGNGKV